MNRPRAALARLVSSRDQTVRVGTREEAEAVKAAAARSDVFEIEPPAQSGGPWRVRYRDPRQTEGRD